MINVARFLLVLIVLYAIYELSTTRETNISEEFQVELEAKGGAKSRYLIFHGQKYRIPSYLHSDNIQGNVFNRLRQGDLLLVRVDGYNSVVTLRYRDECILTEESYRESRDFRKKRAIGLLIWFGAILVMALIWGGKGRQNE